MISRRSEQYLSSWYGRARRKPLILRGARQGGKSTLVRRFAASHNLTLNEINLEKHPELDRVLQSLDVKRVLLEIEGLLGRAL